MEDYKKLIIGYLSNELDPGEIDRLIEWINENPEHKLIAGEITESLLLLEKKPQFHQPDLLWDKLQPQLSVEQKHRNRKFGLLKMVASWLLCLAIGSAITLWIAQNNKSTGSKTSEITSPLGARSLIKLPDGTSVWLNAGSKLVYDEGFDKKDRRVNLTGEAYFWVATNKAKPFIVNTSDIVVRALGTKFNVKAYPEEKTVTTILEEGKIDVRVVNDSKSENKIMLHPKEKIVFYKEGYTKPKDNPKQNKVSADIIPKEIPVQLEISSHVNTDLYTSWKENNWIIEGIPLSTLAPLLERRYNVRLIFENDDLKKYKFTGTIKNETIEQIMNLLRLTAPVDYTFDHEFIRLKLNNKVIQRFKNLTSKN